MPVTKLVKECFSKLEQHVSAYCSQSDVKRLVEAFEFANEAHSGQLRKSGEPYIIHPVNAGIILAKMQVDIDTVITAILHDVPEDTTKTINDIKEKFGTHIAHLVSGVTKLSAVHYNNDMQAREVDALRRLFLVMAKDIRVILVKLADRLHNMRTLGYVVSEKASRIAKETMEIYSPLANLLGLWEIRQELDDLCFQYVYPDDFKEISRKVEDHRRGLRDYIVNFKKEVKHVLNTDSVAVEIHWKHLYSIYRKVKRGSAYGLPLLDTPCVRVIVDSVEECYSMLGEIHMNWTPKPGEIKDYIAVPKPNGYQSLHTITFAPKGQLVEFQIKTKKMHEEALNGIVARFLNEREGSEAGMNDFLSSTTWVKKVKNLQKRTGIDFIEELKRNVLSDRVYVFSADGEMIDIPKGSSTLDYAYKISKRLGNNYCYALVNKEREPISYELESGDIIEIITDPKVRPEREWMQFVITDEAKQAIQYEFQKRTEEEQFKLGETVLDVALRILRKGEFRNYNNSTKVSIAQTMGYVELYKFLVDVGKGLVSEEKVLDRVIKNEAQIFQNQQFILQSVINKLFGKSDKIRVKLKLCMMDRIGLLADVFDVLSSHKANVIKLNARKSFFSSKCDVVDVMVIEVTDFNQLRRTMNGLTSIVGMVDVRQVSFTQKFVFVSSIVVSILLWATHPFFVKEIILWNGPSAEISKVLYWFSSFVFLVMLFYTRKFAIYSIPKVISRKVFESVLNVFALIVGATMVYEISSFGIGVDLTYFIPSFAFLLFLGYRWSK